MKYEIQRQQCLSGYSWNGQIGQYEKQHYKNYFMSAAFQHFPGDERITKSISVDTVTPIFKKESEMIVTHKRGREAGDNDENTLTVLPV